MRFFIIFFANAQFLFFWLLYKLDLPECWYWVLDKIIMKWKSACCWRITPICNAGKPTRTATNYGTIQARRQYEELSFQQTDLKVIWMYKSIRFYYWLSYTTHIKQWFSKYTRTWQHFLSIKITVFSLYELNKAKEIYNLLENII